MRRPEPGLAEVFIEAVVRLIWGLRVEIVLGGGTVGLGTATSVRFGPTWGTLAVVALIGAALAVPPVRRLLARLLTRARVRRQWHRGVRTAGVPAFEERLPSVVGIDRLPAGERLHLRVPLGSCVADLEVAAEVIAAALGVREVRVRRDPANASRADVVVVRRDPLAASGSLPWPSVDAERLSLWEPIPVGVGEDGQTVAVSLPERNVLLGGEPGAGKSVALSLPVATAALDPTVKLWLLDGKLVELAPWAGCAVHSVGVSVAEAIDVLRLLRTEMDLRYAELLAGRKRKVGPADGMALHVVVCDELAHYLTVSDRREREEFTNVMRDLVSRGRAAGMIVLAATQKPSADVVPTSLRDLFGFRWAMRCSTPRPPTPSSAPAGPPPGTRRPRSTPPAGESGSFSTKAGSPSGCAPFTSTTTPLRPSLSGPRPSVRTQRDGSP
ncbi:MAG: FtsK/SpoIIIE domain-containing protein [Acidimicrobiales bacterium]